MVDEGKEESVVDQNTKKVAAAIKSQYKSSTYIDSTKSGTYHSNPHFPQHETEAQ